MITARQSTVEMPLTVIDHIADLQKCHSVGDIIQFSKQLDVAVVSDERFTRAVRDRLLDFREERAA